MKITLLVKPGCKHEKITLQPTLDGQDILVVCVKEPPIDGKANKAVIESLSDLFSIAKSKIVLHKGHTSRYKIVDIPISNDLFFKTKETINTL